MRDRLGNIVTGADEASLEHYERGLRQLQTFTGDPVASANAAISESPGFVMAQMLKAWLYALSTDKAAMDVARQIYTTVRNLPITAREAGHVAALGRLVGGEWNGAGETLAAVARDFPHDALALQAGHQIDFFTGNAPMLRDRIAGALPHWDNAMPGYHALLAAHAFGLEETGDYIAAEAAGRKAVELEPHDGWGQHAVAHVMEMQCRQADGIGWMRTAFANGADDSFMKVHNWWHLALFHYDLGQHDEVFSLYDGPIYGDYSTLALNMVDAAALLWRLHLGGVAAGERWQVLADNWTPFAGDGNYAFNDMHAMMAFAAAGRTDAARALLAAQEAAAEAGGDNAGFTRDIGLPATRGILAFEDGDYKTAAELLGPIRAIAHRFGGSHAQRDVIDLTLIEAAIRLGDAATARKLTEERMIARPHSPLSAIFRDRAAAISVDP
ncbi:tetratricopeptide repeat protein [Mesorhizobium sp. J428]|uniref:tetratricopeptide repeat protein n=1 Tax=Mesorhizobium sp. J428 TaxID=2898440 RepID=UPI002150FACD|nr:tetratricopeptide repeat protein [Mesorhizobium sp. J428]MCR5856177.1 tetratricopeptide repeat protein [Mesorhizobium sp. J428]